MPSLSKKNSKKTGFSLIELLVSVAILVIVSGLVFFNQSGFNNTVLLENLAYEVSLTIREAQSYGLQSKEVENTFQAGFGVYFDKSNNDSLILYADKNSNHRYEGEPVDKIIDELKMKNGNFIKSLCLGGACSPTTKLSISFIRPNPTAYINRNSGGNENIGEIVIESPKGEQRKIIVNKVGQISIEAI